MNFCLFCDPLSLETTETELNVTEIFIDLFDVWLYTIIIFLAAYQLNGAREDPKKVCWI